MIDVRLYAIKNRLSKIKNVVLIGSGKGGVGKSTIAYLISELLSEKFSVGLLDADIHGPVQQIFFNVKGYLDGDDKGIKPVTVGNIKLMSIGYFEDKNPLTVSGKNKRELIMDLLAFVNWGDLDYLVIDLPPGTGDEVLTIIRFMRSKARAIVITTPGISLNVVNRFIRLIEEEKIPIISVINNMAYLECEGKKLYPFGNPEEVHKINYKTIDLPMTQDFKIIKELLKNNIINYL
jgi:ATP-binding protein involved in chromosome partitioning